MAHLLLSCFGGRPQAARHSSSPGSTPTPPTPQHAVATAVLRLLPESALTEGPSTLITLGQLQRAGSAISHPALVSWSGGDSRGVPASDSTACGTFVGGGSSLRRRPALQVAAHEGQWPGPAADAAGTEAVVDAAAHECAARLQRLLDGCPAAHAAVLAMASGWADASLQARVEVPIPATNQTLHLRPALTDAPGGTLYRSIVLQLVEGASVSVKANSSSNSSSGSSSGSGNVSSTARPADTSAKSAPRWRANHAAGPATAGGGARMASAAARELPATEPSHAASAAAAVRVPAARLSFTPPGAGGQGAPAPVMAAGSLDTQALSRGLQCQLPPCDICTLISLQPDDDDNGGGGSVVFQNELSKEYYGVLVADHPGPDAAGEVPHCHGAESLLRALAPEQPGLAEEAVASVRAGRQWKSVLAVPRTAAPSSPAAPTQRREPPRHQAPVLPSSPSAADDVQIETDESLLLGNQSQDRHSPSVYPSVASGASLRLMAFALGASRLHSGATNPPSPSNKLRSLMASQGFEALANYADMNGSGSGRHALRSLAAARSSASFTLSAVDHSACLAATTASAAPSSAEQTAAQQLRRRRSMHAEASARRAATLQSFKRGASSVDSARTLCGMAAVAAAAAATGTISCEGPGLPSPARSSYTGLAAEWAAGEGADGGGGGRTVDVTLRDLLRAADQDEEEGQGEEAQQGGEELEEERERGEGEEQKEEVIYHEVLAAPVRDPVTGNELMLLIQRDVTDRMEAESGMMSLVESWLELLDQMFPRHVLELLAKNSVAGQLALCKGGSQLADLASVHEGVTCLFCDIAGFTDMSKRVQPSEVMQYLNTLFSVMDNLVDQFKVYKVETAGDCYIVAGGLMTTDESGFTTLDPNPDPAEGAERVLAFAKAVLECAQTVPMPHNGQPTVVRVGVHTGPCTSGVVGSKLPKFGLFGDTMNTASRMESTCRHGCIQASEATFGLLAPSSRQDFAPTGGVEVKGKGRMDTFVWDPRCGPPGEPLLNSTAVLQASAIAPPAPDADLPVASAFPAAARRDWLDKQTGLAMADPQAQDLGLRSALTPAATFGSSQSRPSRQRAAAAIAAAALRGTGALPPLRPASSNAMSVITQVSSRLLGALQRQEQQPAGGGAGGAGCHGPPKRAVTCSGKTLMLRYAAAAGGGGVGGSGAGGFTVRPPVLASAWPDRARARSGAGCAATAPPDVAGAAASGAAGLTPAADSLQEIDEGSGMGTASAAVSASSVCGSCSVADEDHELGALPQSLV